MKIYNYSQKTKEFINESVADKSPLELGVYLIPALSTTIKPPETTENEVAIFDEENKTWSVVADYRSVSLWDKSSAIKVTAELGKTPDDLNATQVEPKIDFPKWDETLANWVINEAFQLAAEMENATMELTKLTVFAAEKIATLQDAVDLGIATETETASLTAWKTYRVLVNRIPTQSGYPTEIDWPPMPE